MMNFFSFILLRIKGDQFSTGAAIRSLISFLLLIIPNGSTAIISYDQYGSRSAFDDAALHRACMMVESVCLVPSAYKNREKLLLYARLVSAQLDQRKLNNHITIRRRKLSLEEGRK